jgi:Na+/phosphate symporter
MSFLIIDVDSIVFLAQQLKDFLGQNIGGCLDQVLVAINSKNLARK